VDRLALAADRRLVAAGDRAGERLLGAEARPALDARSHEREERVAVDAGRGGEPLGGGLDGDEEVRGDRGGGVVGGAVLVGDCDRREADLDGDRVRNGARAGCRARDGGGGAAERGRAGGGDRHQRMEREALVGGEHVERRRAGAVADERPAVRPRGDRGGRGGDLAVRHAQHDDVGVRTSRAAAERSLDGDARVTQRRRERVAETARADDRAAQARKGWGGGFPFQFPHGRYRSASSERWSGAAEVRPRG
jgi:hypothetical protein